MTDPGSGQWHESDGSYQVDPLTGQPLRPQPQEQPPMSAHAYGGYAGPPPTHGLPEHRQGSAGRAGLIVVFSLLGVLVIGGGIALAVALSTAGFPQAQTPAPDESPRPVPPPVMPSSSVPQPTTTESPAAPPAPPPVIRGWQSVASAGDGVAYDVPAGWKVETPTTLAGFEDESGPRTAMHAVATYRDNACPGVSGSYRGRAGLMTAGDYEPRAAAEVAAKLWAEAAAEVPEGDPSVPRPEATEITVAGGMQAFQASVTITPPPGECGAPEMKVTIVTLPLAADKTAVLVLYTDQGIAQALPASTAEKIISSFRPL